MNVQRQQMQQQQSNGTNMNDNAEFEEVWNTKMAQLARSMKRSEATHPSSSHCQREVLLAEHDAEQNQLNSSSLFNSNKVNMSQINQDICRRRRHPGWVASRSLLRLHNKVAVSLASCPPRDQMFCNFFGRKYVTYQSKIRNSRTKEEAVGAILPRIQDCFVKIDVLV
jgi:hypothetical protein